MRYLKLAVIVLLVGTALVASSGCQWLKARDQYRKGAQAFRSGQFQIATDHFRNAVEMDPSLLNAKLFLATAMVSQYIPGGKSKENVKIGEDAIVEFEKVVEAVAAEPQESLTEEQTVARNNALGGIAGIYYNMERFEDAKIFQRKRIKIDPNNPEPYYWVGVIDWARAYPKRMGYRQDLKIQFKPDEPIPRGDREDLAEMNGEVVEEGIQMLEKAIELKPNHWTAMTYLNLLYRERADLQAESSSRSADLSEADSWMEKALDIQRENMAAEAAG